MHCLRWYQVNGGAYNPAPYSRHANPLHYGRQLTALDNLDFGSLHLDIEDSSFINNITFR
ncbi:hypothetical protein ACLK1S_26815 [Escherichia coli]